MVGLTELANRKPRALSGGQQQRVALARVLVTKPKALLLDEPLGDLDRLLQLRMRVELRNLQRQLGLMFIHVTHNQEESLSMADRIVVMNDARIQQVADPLTIATRPATELVARFMGDNNIFRGRVVGARRRPARDRGRARRAREREGARGRRAGRETRRWWRCARLRSRSTTPVPRRARQRRRLRDHLRRVPRRPRQGPPDGRRRAPARRRSRASAIRRCAAARASGSEDLVEGGGCPAPHRLSPTSTSRRSRRPRRSRAPPLPSARSASRARAGAPARRRLGDARLGTARLRLARLLPRRAARLHRPRQLLDAHRHRLRARTGRPRTTATSCIPSTSTTPTGRTC